LIIWGDKSNASSQTSKIFSEIFSGTTGEKFTDSGPEVKTGEPCEVQAKMTVIG